MVFEPARKAPRERTIGLDHGASMTLEPRAGGYLQITLDMGAPELAPRVLDLGVRQVRQLRQLAAVLAEREPPGPDLCQIRVTVDGCPGYLNMSLWGRRFGLSYGSADRDPATGVPAVAGGMTFDTRVLAELQVALARLEKTI